MSRKRFRPSGPNIPNDQRGGTKLEIRCPHELAALFRAKCAALGIPYAQAISAWLESVAGAPTSSADISDNSSENEEISKNR